MADQRTPTPLPPMPPTDDREPYGVGDYLESDQEWVRRHPEAVEWFIDNHAAIRERLK